MTNEEIADMWKKTHTELPNAHMGELLPAFAMLVATTEREACIKALDAVQIIADEGDYSGQSEAVQECIFAIQERSNK